MPDTVKADCNCHIPHIIGAAAEFNYVGTLASGQRSSWDNDSAGLVDGFKPGQYRFTENSCLDIV